MKLWSARSGGVTAFRPVCDRGYAEAMWIVSTACHPRVSCPPSSRGASPAHRSRNAETFPRPSTVRERRRPGRRSIQRNDRCVSASCLTRRDFRGLHPSGFRGPRAGGHDQRPRLEQSGRMGGRVRARGEHNEGARMKRGIIMRAAVLPHRIEELEPRRVCAQDSGAGGLS